jgi:hypothetical protein
MDTRQASRVTGVMPEPEASRGTAGNVAVLRYAFDFFISNQLAKAHSDVAVTASGRRCEEAR